MGEGDRRGRQPHSVGGQVEGAEGGGGHQERVDRGADVVVEAGQGQLGRSAAASRLVRRLVDVDRQPGPGQDDRRDQTVGPGTHDDGVHPSHRFVTVPASSLLAPR